MGFWWFCACMWNQLFRLWPLDKYCKYIKKNIYFVQCTGYLIPLLFFADWHGNQNFDCWGTWFSMVWYVQVPKHIPIRTNTYVHLFNQGVLSICFLLTPKYESAQIKNFSRLYGSNPIAAPKSYEVYPSTSGLLSFKKPETVLWTIAKHYYYYYIMINFHPKI